MATGKTTVILDKGQKDTRYRDAAEAVQVYHGDSDGKPMYFSDLVRKLIREEYIRYISEEWPPAKTVKTAKKRK